jgi:hypothetical protein
MLSQGSALADVVAMEPLVLQRAEAVPGRFECQLLGPRTRFMITISAIKGPLTCVFSEPPIGIEPMTYVLREARSFAASA